MQTTSVLIQSLCVPCCNRCRHCLLSANGTVEGADWDRSVWTAERYLNELRQQRPELNTSFSFGYSMEHPKLREAIRTLHRLGSPTATFLQCDGMKMRNETECRALAAMLRDEGIQQLNFTVYGLPDYHDRFAGRSGDFALIERMMKAAREIGLPLTEENVSQADAVVERMTAAGCSKTSLFIPHEEGRGRLLEDVRLRLRDLSYLFPAVRGLLNETIYRTEAEWLKAPELAESKSRHILISLRKDNIEDYEKRSAVSVLEEIEALDERYYQAFPSFSELAAQYGDPKGDRLYRVRDLFYHYRRLYAAAHPVDVPDLMDETRSGSRRI